MFIGQQSSIFVKKLFRYGVDYQFSPKIIRHPWMKMEKRWKLFVIHGWKRENVENWLFAAAENQKQINSAFQPWRTNEKRWNLAFPHGENQKSAKTGFLSRGKLKISEKYFPKVGKTGKCGKSVFPNLGRTKNGRKWLSQHWEDWKTAKIGFPARGKTKNQRKSTFPHEGKSKNAENYSSLVSEMQKTRKTASRLQATDEKRWKQPVVGRQNAENAKNHSDTEVNRRFFEKSVQIR